MRSLWDNARQMPPRTGQLLFTFKNTAANEQKYAKAKYSFDNARAKIFGKAFQHDCIGPTVDTG